ncbi:MAG: hypothetical protein I3274_02640 [Candidatus Moeniiplasma glomeromycotorum]|nr:hypothetical protein [Candidatus Moeniiplasma glomeromycotorum]MCE8167502.1 hypothetical protein [Candidatus Moeniiplasma glomeromycotorum]
MKQKLQEFQRIFKSLKTKLGELQSQIAQLKQIVREQGLTRTESGSLLAFDKDEKQRSWNLTNLLDKLNQGKNYFWKHKGKVFVTSLGLAATVGYLRGGEVSYVEQDNDKISEILTSEPPKSVSSSSSTPSISPTPTSEKINSTSVNSPTPTPSKKSTSREKFTVGRSITKIKPTPTNTFVLVGHAKGGGFKLLPEHWTEVEESWQEHLKEEGER